MPGREWRLARQAAWVYNGCTTERCPMGKNRSTSSTKAGRLSIRVDAARKAVIARAAKQHGDTLSDFVLENAYQMATEQQQFLQSRQATKIGDTSVGDGSVRKIE